MNDIRVSPTVQLGVLGAVLAVILAVIAIELPELRRYLKIRSM
jgi:hypothetical protein